MSASPLRAEQLKFRLLWIGIFAIMLLFASVTYPQPKIPTPSINVILLLASLWHLIVFFTPLARMLGASFDSFAVFMDAVFITWVVRITGGFESELTYLYFIELLLIAVFSERLQLLLGFLFSTLGLCSSLLTFQAGGIPAISSRAILVRFDQWKQENLSALGVRTAGLVAVYLIAYLGRLIQGRFLPAASTPERSAARASTPVAPPMESSATKESRTQRALDEQLSIIAHELRSPLTILRAYTDLLMDPQRKNETEDIVSKIDAEVSQLSEMVSNLGALVDEGNFSGSQDFQKIQLIPLLRSLADRYRSLGSPHEFVLQFRRSEIPLWGNHIKLTRVFDNLLGNAVKYSPQGGRITLSVDVMERRKLGGRMAQLSNVPDSKLYAVTKITDTGIGISAQELSSAFEKFQRLDAERTPHIPGSGVGLYLVRKIVEQHQGTVDLDSTKGKGTTVTVALPLWTKGESSG